MYPEHQSAKFGLIHIMVQSYKGVFHHRNEDEHKEKKVKDYMTTNVISFKADQLVIDAMKTLLKNRISGAPVVDDEGKLIGVLSEGDCLKEVIKGRYHNTLNDPGTVGEHMTKNVTTIDAELNIFEAAHFFLDRKFRRFPVVNEGKVVGLFTQTDVMKAVNDL